MERNYKDMQQVLQTRVLLASQKIGTALGDMRQLTVTENLGIGVVNLERLQQSPQGVLLSLGAGVFRDAVLVESSLVADADGMLVVVPGMGSDEVLMTSLVGLSIAGDVIMVAGEPESRLVTGNQPGDRERTVATRRATMNDNKIYFSHIISH